MLCPFRFAPSRCRSTRGSDEVVKSALRFTRGLPHDPTTHMPVPHKSLRSPEAVVRGPKEQAPSPRAQQCVPVASLPGQRLLNSVCPGRDSGAETPASSVRDSSAVCSRVLGPQEPFAGTIRRELFGHCSRSLDDEGRRQFLLKSGG